MVNIPAGNLYTQLYNLGKKLGLTQQMCQPSAGTDESVFLKRGLQTICVTVNYGGCQSKFQNPPTASESLAAEFSNLYFNKLLRDFYAFLSWRNTDKGNY